MKGKTSRTGVSAAAIVAALLLATPMLLLVTLVTPVLAASITVVHQDTGFNRGPVGSTVVISGTGFGSGTTVNIYFDSNRNGIFESSEIIATATGPSFSTSVTIPAVTGGYGDYIFYASDGTVSASAIFTIPQPAITTLDPPKGTAETILTVHINYFTLGHGGQIFFDRNNNEVPDLGDIIVAFTASELNATGGLSKTLTVPSDIGFGTFKVVAINAINEKAVRIFTVEQPVIVISPTFGIAGTTISVSVNFYNKTSDAQPTFVFFDTNGNGRFDTGEPRLPSSGGLTLNNTGGASGFLTVPSVPPGIYKVYANNSLGQVKFATFEVKEPLVTITPTRGTAETSVTIDIAFFEEGRQVTIGIDINNNGEIDTPEEILATVTPPTGSGGNVTGIIATIPSSIGFGTFVVNATNKPSGGGQVATTTFKVEQPVIAIDPSAGVPGTSISVSVNFYNKTSDAQPTFVFFDTNGNGRFDTGEPRSPPSGGLTLNNTGGASGSLTVPSVPPGIYKVYANNSLGQVKFATFEVKEPIMSISPTSGGPGTTVAVFLNFFRKDAPAGDTFVFFDTNGNGIFDPGEPRSPPSGGLTLNNTGGAVTTIQVPFAISTGSYKIFAVNNLQSRFATFDVVSPEEAIINKLDTIVIPKLDQIISLLTDDTFGLNAIKAAVELVRTRVETIGGTLLDAINNVEAKLETVKNLLDAIEAKLDDPSRWVSDADLSAAVSTITSAISEVSAKLGTFTGTDTVASLLYQIIAGDVVSSKAGTNIAVTSASPYVIGGFPANKAFRGTLTIEIDTTLGSGVFLAVEVWDGDSWARVWRSASNAPAGTAVSIDIAGLTDGTGNAVRIVTNAATPRQFDYVFVYHIDLG